MFRDAPLLSHTRFVAAPPHDRDMGLLGWFSTTIGGAFHLDGIVVRRTRSGRYEITFPQRRDREGRPHAYIRPASYAARQAIEAAAIEAAREQGVLS